MVLRTSARPPTAWKAIAGELGLKQEALCPVVRDLRDLKLGLVSKDANRRSGSQEIERQPKSS